MTGPVTVSITRHVDPGAEDQMLAWLRAGTQLSERFDGFLGSGWVRPAPESTEWHMLYRFADDDSLQVWEASPQRQWWLHTADDFIESSRHERRTGIEGWFDEPSTVDVADLRPTPPAPPRWKQMCAIFIVFFPLSLVANELGRVYLADWWLWARVLLTVCVMTPLMTYVFLPRVTKLLAPWLNAAPQDVSALLVAGTTSDAGKSIVTTGLCRAFARRGLRVAPFKAQNMSNNSMVCVGPDGTGAEIGRAQWIQALAARATPEPAMNPILLKPGGDRRSHVVVMGQPGGEISSAEFIGGRTHLAAAAHRAYDDLSSRYDVVVCEGAGSPTEINLRAGDYVNMGLARHGDIPTIVVGDIDRGGVFAAMYGTVALLEPADQRLVAGFVVNKFRGDETLLAPGLEQLERLTGRRVYGVLPWSPDLWLDSEDALDLDGRRAGDSGDALRVAVVRLPRISNFTDVDALGLEPGVDVVFASDPRAVSDADVVVLPGTRATISDLAWLRARGLDRAILDHAAAGRPVLGICGGFQMLGRTITDPLGVEGDPGASVEGLGLLDVTTTFGADKVLRLPTGEALGAEVTGYEIHHGRITRGDVDELLGGARAGHVLGTMWHGSLESDAFRQAFLTEAATAAGRAYEPSGVSFAERREARLDLLGDLVEQRLDVDALLAIAEGGAPDGLAVLPPGLG